MTTRPLHPLAGVTSLTQVERWVGQLSPGTKTATERAEELDAILDGLVPDIVIEKVDAWAVRHSRDLEARRLREVGPPDSPLVRFSIPGRAAGKKTSASVIFPGISKLAIRKTPRMLAQARRDGKKGGPMVFGVRDLLQYLGETIPRNIAAAAALCFKAGAVAQPIIVPPKSHDDWKKTALRAVARVRCPRPVVPQGHLIRLEAVIYLAAGQTGDLVNFIEALQDMLQEAGIITNDYWVNGFGDTRREKTDPQNPRIDVSIWDLGEPVEFELPKVNVRGLPALKDSMLPVHFSIVAPDGKSLQASAPSTITRKKLVLDAVRIWRQAYDEELPAGATIACAGADKSVQEGLFP